MNCFKSFYSVKCAKIKYLVSLKISCFIKCGHRRALEMFVGHNNMRADDFAMHNIRALVILVGHRM